MRVDLTASDPAFVIRTKTTADKNPAAKRPNYMGHRHLTVLQSGGFDIRKASGEA